MKLNKNKIALQEAKDKDTNDKFSNKTNSIGKKGNAAKANTIESVDLDEKKIELDVPDDFDIEDASRGDLARMIKAALEADTNGKADTSSSEAKKDIVQNAAEAEQVADLIVNPYGTADLSEIEEVLQDALENTMYYRQADMPGLCNVILFGPAGTGKTAIVRQWCAAHNINMFDCKASSLDVATVGGIPYPVKDEKTGKYSQMPIASSYWDDLFKPNTVLFLDEYNRAPDNITGTLLSLVNEKELPISSVDPKTGKTKNKHRFDNLLFTIIAINPAGGTFQTVKELDAAEISRFARILPTRLDPKELLSYITRIYDEALKNQLLTPDARAKWEGQQNLANVLLADKTFLFDNTDDTEKIMQNNTDKGTLNTPLNYRSFFQNLLACNGTKADYLKKLKWARFSDTRTTMLKNILQNYVDKPLKGNTVFSKGASQISDIDKQKVTAASAKIISDMLQQLDED